MKIAIFINVEEGSIIRSSRSDGYATETNGRELHHLDLLGVLSKGVGWAGTTPLPRLTTGAAISGLLLLEDKRWVGVSTVVVCIAK